MEDTIETHLQAVRDLLTQPLPTDAVQLTQRLTTVAGHVAAALDETMGRAAIAGSSMRTIAFNAQLAPNSVPPRLARSAVLGPYAEGGKVSAEQIAVARADQRSRLASDPTTKAPFTFQPRKRSTP